MIILCLYVPSFQFLAHLVLEFFLVVKKMNVSMEHHYLPELVLKVLVDAGQFSKLQVYYKQRFDLYLQPILYILRVQQLLQYR